MCAIASHVPVACMCSPYMPVVRASLSQLFFVRPPLYMSPTYPRIAHSSQRDVGVATFGPARVTSPCAVTLSARVGVERASIVGLHSNTCTASFLKATFHVTLRIPVHGNRQLHFSCPKMNKSDTHV